jgi:phage terminase large subunit-like protein
MSDEAYPSFCLTASARAAYDAARAGGWSEWVVGMADVHAIHEGCYFDLPAAERVREFFEKHLRHATGDFKGRPFTLLDWQWRDVIGPLFGWKRGDGRRRFNRGYLSCAKKNGKSGLSAGIALYLLLADGEAGAEVYSAAADRDQASLIYREAVKMILANPSLGRICGHVDSSKTITGPGRCFYKALSAEAPTKEGLNASAIIFDELHAQPHRELWDTLRYAGRARRQPLLLAITTAGSDKESICGEQYEYANRVLSGEVADTSFYARIYEAGMDDWGLEETWRKANPSLGVTVQLDQFRADGRRVVLIRLPRPLSPAGNVAGGWTCRPPTTPPRWCCCSRRTMDISTCCRGSGCHRETRTTSSASTAYHTGLGRRRASSR